MYAPAHNKSVTPAAAQEARLVPNASVLSIRHIWNTILSRHVDNRSMTRMTSRFCSFDSYHPVNFLIRQDESQDDAS